MVNAGPRGAPLKTLPNWSCAAAEHRDETGRRGRGHDKRGLPGVERGVGQRSTAPATPRRGRMVSDGVAASALLEVSTIPNGPEPSGDGWL